MSTVRQVCSACAAVAGGLAAGGLLVVAAGTPGLRIRGSVSQLGATGQPLADTYQVAIFGISLAVCLLAVAITPISRLATAALASTAALGAVSAVVPCTTGCPLPPAPTATTGDVVHVASSTAAFVALACAMLLLARSGTDPLSRVCRDCLILVTVLGTPVAIAIVVTGEGLLNGVLERAMLGVALAWLVIVSVLAARPRAADAAK
jgi:peptidoglycan biosynthesis protein MviN/MurJ (putative lipid II flippase)